MPKKSSPTRITRIGQQVCFECEAGTFFAIITNEGDLRIIRYSDEKALSVLPDNDGSITLTSIKR